MSEMFAYGLGCLGQREKGLSKLSLALLPYFPNLTNLIPGKITQFLRICSLDLRVSTVNLIYLHRRLSVGLFYLLIKLPDSIENQARVQTLA